MIRKKLKVVDVGYRKWYVKRWQQRIMREKRNNYCNKN